MSDITGVEQNINQIDIKEKYNTLISNFPLENSFGALSHRSSFPEGKISEKEREWANSFLDLGSDIGLLGSFGEAVGCVSTRGLQLLREQANKKGETILKEVKSNLTSDSLLSLLRNDYQAKVLFYEEGLRGARDIDNNFWFGEGNQLDAASRWLRFSKDAFREIGEFKDNKVGKLTFTRKWIDKNYKAVENMANNNENYYRESYDERSSDNWADQAAKHDSGELVFWSSLNGFVDNLEFTSEHEKN